MQDLGREGQKTSGEEWGSILAMETAQAEIMGHRAWAGVEPQDGPSTGATRAQVACTKTGHFHQPFFHPSPCKFAQSGKPESVFVMIALQASEFKSDLDDLIFLETESLIFKHRDHFKCNNHYSNNLFYF